MRHIYFSGTEALKNRYCVWSLPSLRLTFSDIKIYNVSGKVRKGKQIHMIGSC